MKDIMLITHFIGLAMGLGTGFAFMFMGIAASKMEEEEGNQLMIKASVLGTMGHIGLLLLLVSGIYMIHPYISVITELPLLIVKLVLFVVLGATIGITSSMLKKAAKGNTIAYLKKTEMLGKINLLLAITIVVLAVLTFH